MILEEENHISVTGGQIWSQIIYPQSVKSKTAIIFLHGGPGSTHDKLKYGLKTIANHYPLIFYDQLGGGKSTLPINKMGDNSLWTIERFVSELNELIEFYKVKQFILFGTSWGASLALEYFFSDQVNRKPSGLIISSPLISTKMWMEDAAKLKAQMPEEIFATIDTCEANGKTDNHEYQAAMEVFYNKHLLKPELITKEEQQRVSNAAKLGFNNHAYLTMWGPSEFYANGSLHNYDRYHDLAKIDIPTLFTCGEFDEATPETVTKFHRQIPHSQFHVMTGCSHQPYFEMPEKYCRILQDFLEQAGFK